MIGGWSRGANAAGCAVIDCTGSEYSTSTSNKRVRARNDEGAVAFAKTISSLATKPLPWLDIPIQDYGVPSLTKEQWDILAQEVLALIDSGINVLVCCQGGHGRSGMVCAILCHILTHGKTGDAVAYIRKQHCKESIDNLKQHHYVNQILGLPEPDPQEYVVQTVTYVGGAGLGFQAPTSKWDGNTFIPKLETSTRYGYNNAKDIVKYMDDHYIDWHESKDGYIEVFESGDATAETEEYFVVYYVKSIDEKMDKVTCLDPSNDAIVEIPMKQLDRCLVDEHDEGKTFTIVGRSNDVDQMARALDGKNVFTVKSGSKLWCYLMDRNECTGPFVVNEIDMPTVFVVTSDGIVHRNYTFLLRNDEMSRIKPDSLPKESNGQSA